MPREEIEVVMTTNVKKPTPPPNKYSIQSFWPKIRVIKYPESLYIVQTRKWFKWKHFYAFHDLNNAIECANELYTQGSPKNKKEVLYKL